MYCDKFRKKMELADALRVAYKRVQRLNEQEQEEFTNWVKTAAKVESVEEFEKQIEGED